MGFSWDPALREREGEESVTAVPAFSRSLSALNGEGFDASASVPERDLATPPGVPAARPSPLSALEPGPGMVAGEIPARMAVEANHETPGPGSSAPALSPGVELSRLPLWGALPFMAVLDAVRTRP